MIINSENCLSTPVESNIENDSPSVENLTLPACNESIRIILFPPKDKQFRYNEETSSFQVESVDLPTNESVSNAVSETNPIEKSDLTPLVEKCNIFSEESDANGGSTPKRTISVDPVREILKVEKVFLETKLGKNCFLKGCKWSPDGLCLLSNSDDSVLRLFEISSDLIDNPQNDVRPVLEMKEGGTIYDYEWYPNMNSSDPVSCVFISASQDAPIHLWDAYTGCLRATYQPINQFDEVTPAYSVTFSPDGSKIYSGYKKYVRIFDTCYPGRISEERSLKVKGNSIFQSNIVSSISVNPAILGLYAVGCYDKTIGIYCEPEGDLFFILKGHSGGITQVKFSSDGRYLFSGGRKDCEILCWDVRNPGKVVFSIDRKVETQQRIQFDLSPDESYLITGTTDCNLKIYNLKNPPNVVNKLEPVKAWRGHQDCVNGVQFHPGLPIFASVSGQRHFSSMECDDDESEEEEEDVREETFSNVENSLKIWSFNHHQL